MTELTRTTIKKDRDNKIILHFQNEIGNIDARIDINNAIPREGVLSIIVFRATLGQTRKEQVKKIIQVLMGCFIEDGEETEERWKGVSEIRAKIRIGDPSSNDCFTSYNVPIVVVRDDDDPEAIFRSWYSRYRRKERCRGWGL